MNRKDVEEKYTWDLSSLFESDEIWEKEFNFISESLDKFDEFSGKVLDSSDNLSKVISLSEEISSKMSNVLTYARMKLDLDTRDSTYQALSSRATKLANEVNAKTSFIIPEILKKEEEYVLNLIEEKEELKNYKKYFKNLFRKKPHTLEKDKEELLAQVSELGQGASQTYGMLLNADLKFEDAIDSNGKKHPLTNGSYISLLMSKDRTLREDAFKKYYLVYKNHINTITSLMASEVNKNILFSKVRNYNSAREAALFQNNVPSSVPDKLIDAVNQNLDTFYKYMKIRKKALGVEKLHMYDIYTPIVKDVDYEINYEEAKDMVIKSLEPLGSEYVKQIENAFKERWIDVYETEGKRSGAYSWGTYSSKPYVLLNHTDDMDSMFTLTHELGHSMHSYLTRSNQPYVYGNYSIFVAEVASTTNEALLNDYLLKSVKEEDKRKYILNHYLEQFRGTIFRQTMFAEFERDIHKFVEEGKALTVDLLCDHYLSLNKKYYGPDVEIDEEIKYEWARIPHMYMNFYVYQYATGFSAAIALSEKILKGNEEDLNSYLEFLSSGSKDYPINILRKAGADMETDEPVNNALNVFKDVVDELEKLI